MRPGWNLGNAPGASAQSTLTFNFWSGATVTYRVTESGSSVTGAVC
ncbi:hypothetical protein RB628_01060 [Streptomyces sp. ADMS]|nr:hypothetical protein [Streptomyces sp. ADMS]MDW4903967.1 hypothetical protein [Streptomyces sp. ADMS]